MSGHVQRYHRSLRSYAATFLVCLLLVGGGWYGIQRYRSQPSKRPAPQVESVQTPTPTPRSGALKQFSGDQFRDLYRAVKYPNTQLFSEPPAITGNQAADARIRTLAESKGYQLTSIPVTVIVKVVGKQLEGDDLLQPLAAKDWNDLYSAAAKEGVALALMSAYRSPEYQRNLFMQRLTANGGNVERIAAGQGDAAVVQTLGMTAVPGYSRHHTGYTVDFWCDDGSGTFMASSCFEWLSDNNYQHAKEHGWIPSYPSGASEQGPEPEAWEYVWVGQDFLRD